jgi:uncharacterized membrane protein
MNPNRFNPQDFINQYEGVPNAGGSMLLGAGLGAGAGGGLAALFGKLTGAYSPGVGALLGAGIGTIPGFLTGLGISSNNRISDRTNAFNTLTPEQQRLVELEWASQMNNAVGDTSFTDWLKQNPQAFRQIMLNDM